MAITYYETPTVDVRSSGISHLVTFPVLIGDITPFDTGSITPEGSTVDERVAYIKSYVENLIPGITENVRPIFRETGITSDAHAILKGIFSNAYVGDIATASAGDIYYNGAALSGDADRGGVTYTDTIKFIQEVSTSNRMRGVFTSQGNYTQSSGVYYLTPISYSIGDRSISKYIEFLVLPQTAMVNGRLYASIINAITDPFIIQISVYGASTATPFRIVANYASSFPVAHALWNSSNTGWGALTAFTNINLINKSSSATMSATIPASASYGRSFSVTQTMEFSNVEDSVYQYTINFDPDKVRFLSDNAEEAGISYVGGGDGLRIYRSGIINTTSETKEYIYKFKPRYNSDATTSITVRAELYRGSVPVTDGEYTGTISLLEYESPYEPIADEDQGGGEDATLDWTSDTPPSPVSPAVLPARGMLRAYKLSDVQASKFHRGLFDTNFWQAITGEWGKNLSAVVSLHSIPFNVSSGGDETIYMGGQAAPDGDGGNATGEAVALTYQTFSGGTVDVPKFYDGYLDYTDTAIYINLPFIGKRQLNPSQCIGKTLSLTYNVNILSGDIVASIYSGSDLIGTYNGNAATSFPISSIERGQALQGALSIASGAASSFAGYYMAGVPGLLAGAAQMATGMASMMRETPVQTGSLSGGGAIMSYRTAFLEIISPRLAEAGDENKFIGGRCRRVAQIGNFSGFTVAEKIHLDGFVATEEEKAEIEQLFSEGVIL